MHDLPDRLVISADQCYFGLSSYPNGWRLHGGRQDDVHGCLGFLSMMHRGFDVGVVVPSLNRGVNVVGGFSATIGRAPLTNRREMHGQISKDVARACDWMATDLRPECYCDDFDIEIGHFYTSFNKDIRKA